MGAERLVAMRCVLILLLWLLPLGLMAQGLPPVAQKKIAADPGKFIEDVQALILGYGQDGSISGAALANYIALQRAGARAAAVQVLLAMDLDGDGSVARDEVGFAAAAASAAGRGRLWAVFARADADGNGLVAPDEVAAHAAAAALKGFSEAKAQAVRALLAFDKDGDGLVTLEEVAAGVAALDEAA